MNDYPRRVYLCGSSLFYYGEPPRDPDTEDPQALWEGKLISKSKVTEDMDVIWISQWCKKCDPEQFGSVSSEPHDFQCDHDWKCRRKPTCYAKTCGTHTAKEVADLASSRDSQWI